ncbi:MAG: hypothetical protein FP814_05675 [Desulfobacterium sp.]|nr:hypothetical protein [Desulfobacteraceae bacterium]MBA3035966.1 hypothetical protein [Desulfobacterium sp.]MBU3948818.1 hypothetical protein [Pseudomonadota bacterium]
MIIFKVLSPVMIMALLGFSTQVQALPFFNKKNTSTLEEKSGKVDIKEKKTLFRIPFLGKNKDEKPEAQQNPEKEEEKDNKKFSLSNIPFVKSFTKKSGKINADLEKKGVDYFSEGYQCFEKKDYDSAVHYLYAYLNSHSPDDTDYEWAEFFFGISLEKQGLSHASVDVLSHLVGRKPNPKITSYSLELFEVITRTLPYDRDKVINQVLGDEEYGFVEGNLMDFINYHKGVFDWEHGFYMWGEGHFKSLKSGSYYYYKYLYEKTLLDIYRNNIDEAVLSLKAILNGMKENDRFKDEVRQTLGRLMYEKEEYKAATAVYHEIQAPILEQAENLLEKAWIHYRAGNYQKAMGLLYAFKAPSFRNCFTPEYYVLKSLIYKEVCHYQRAMDVIDEFKAHYGQALDMIYNREEAKDNRSLLLVILNKRNIKYLWEFMSLLEKEFALVQTFPESDLKAYLSKIYELEMKKTGNEFKYKMQAEYEEMANSLLRYEEESHLLEYEIGLDMYQRVQEYHYKKNETEAKAENVEHREVAYRFQGEFWNNELDDYKVNLPNKCECSEEWDVFFK